MSPHEEQELEAARRLIGELDEGIARVHEGLGKTLGGLDQLVDTIASPKGRRQVPPELQPVIETVANQLKLDREFLETMRGHIERYGFAPTNES